MRDRNDWRDRPPPERDRPLEDDFGQADYSTDYSYDPEARRGYRLEPDPRDVRDYGQADYGHAYAYDPELRRGYRRDGGEPRRDFGEMTPSEREAYEARRGEPRTWQGRAPPGQRRRGASDRVLWVAVTEALERARGLDTSDIEVMVEGGEVTLNGTVRRREDKRRAEDLADIRDVENVQNNLRVRRRWGFGF